MKVSGKFGLTLSQFILRSEVLKLYREFLKACKQIPESHQKDMLKYIKEDFKANKHHSDELAIKMQLNRGRKSLKQLQTMIDLQK